jgi:hypothetical protein
VLVDGRVAGTLTADRSRPDVTMYGERGTRSGFDGTVPVPAGDHAVCVDARLVGRSDEGTSLGCRPVRALPGSAPTGVVDVVANAGEVQGVRVAGWTLDPDTAASTDVHVYVGSNGVSVRGDRDRPDIATVFPGYGADHGFDVTLPAAIGRHRVCAYAINAGPGTTHTLLGCRDVTVAVQPYGAFDGAERTADGRLRVHGWDADPNTTAPIPVHVYVRSAAGTTGHNLTADRSRPDVERAFPGAGDRRGFDSVVAAPAGRLEVCAFAINVGPGDHQLLGCRTV